MALTATIYKVALSIADMDRSYFHDHALTIARHPSETAERVAVRLLAFALHAHERLEFGKGLSADEEPAVWHKHLTGEIALWVDVGQPEEKRLRKALGRAEQVVVYNYGGRIAEMWWNQHKATLTERKNLAVYAVATDASTAFADMLQRNMTLHITVQDEIIWVNDGQRALEITLTKKKSASITQR